MRAQPALWLASALLVAPALRQAEGARTLARSEPPTAGAARLLYGAPLDANREPAAALERIPGLGPRRAAAIVAGRPYCGLADLDRVPGMGPATLAAMAPHVAFPAPPPYCAGQLHEENR